MSRSRRIYLYTAALFGLVASLVSLVALVWRLIGAQVTSLVGAEVPAGLLAGPILPWLVLFVVALGTWLFHMVTANREARPLTMAGAAERASSERKAYLYLGRLAAVSALAAQLWLLIREVVRALLSGGTEGLRAGASLPAAFAGGAVVAFVYWLYLRYEANRDDDFGHERARGVQWRRVYIYVIVLTGGVLAFVGGGELLRAGIRVLLTPLSGDTSWHIPASGALAALIVGLSLGSAGWRAANRAAAANPPAETNALSRVLVRHGGVLLSTLVTLVALGYLVEQIILRAISRPAGIAGRPLLGLFDWPWALAYLPIAALAWISYAGGARGDADWGGESPRTAAIRRVIRYLVTAASLVAFWYGLTEFARLILQVFLGADTSTATAAEWVQRFASSAAFLLIGAPAWWGHWWSQQIRVRADGAEGFAERASLIRRVYLTVVVLVGAAVVVAAAGFGAFLALNWQSAGSTDGVRAAVAGAVATALVGVFWTLVHGLTLRGDMRWLDREQATRLSTPAQVEAPIAGKPLVADVHPPAVATPVATATPVLTTPPTATQVTSTLAATAGPRQYRREELTPLVVAAKLSTEPGPRPAYALAVIDGKDGAVGRQLLAALRAAYRDVLLWPIGLTETAQAALSQALGEEPVVVPDDALAHVAGIFVPSDAMMPGASDVEVTLELLQTLAATRAKIVLLPPGDDRVRWVAAPSWPLERWIENAVIEAGNILDSQ